MYNMTTHKSNLTKFADLPDIKEATTIDITQYNITYKELLCWLDNNTKVKHVLRYTGENDYHIFFKNKDEYKKLSEFLETKFTQAA